MRIGIGIGVRVNGEPVDPARFLDGVADLLDRGGIEAEPFETEVVFTAGDAITLAELAGPVAEWWQSFEPSTRGDVALTMIGPGGRTDLTYCLPERAVENVRHLIVTECGPRYEAGEAPGAVRRAAAGLLRRVRTGFTASTVHIDESPDCLVVAVAGRDLDDLPRSIEFQSGYCLVDEHHVPVFQSLESLRLAGDRLRLTLTPDAANAWGMRSTTLTVRLRMEPDQIRELRAGLRRVFTSASDPPPDLRL